MDDGGIEVASVIEFPLEVAGVGTVPEGPLKDEGEMLVAVQIDSTVVTGWGRVNGKVRTRKGRLIALGQPVPACDGTSPPQN